MHAGEKGCACSIVLLPFVSARDLAAGVDGDARFRFSSLSPPFPDETTNISFRRSLYRPWRTFLYTYIMSR